MTLFTLLRPLLFALDEEKAHKLALTCLKAGIVPPVKSEAVYDPSLKVECLGKVFSNPLGLAAGFDKDAEALVTLGQQGLSFIEAGTVTPKPQSGNPKPRLFRLTEDEAIINRMGFNSHGADAVAKNLEKFRKQPLPIIGVNLGKNKETIDAKEDYAALIRRFHGLADYLVINISSPNTPGLRDLQQRDALTGLLAHICHVLAEKEREHNRKVPLLVKIAPDLTVAEQEMIAEVVTAQGVDGLVISNTSIGLRERLSSPKRQESGGLSGRPLFASSTEVLRNMYRFTGGKLPLMGVGGIFSGQDAYTKIRAGATLVQIYTALIYHGFDVVPQICEELAGCLKRDGFSSIAEAVGVDA